jgi:hypothetical protein
MPVGDSRARPVPEPASELLERNTGSGEGTSVSIVIVSAILLSRSLTDNLFPQVRPRRRPRIAQIPKGIMPGFDLLPLPHPCRMPPPGNIPAEVG